MKLYNIFNEDWKIVPSIDKERYQERRGLEGPYGTKSGKVVYYDPKEGKYYDPDSDIYIDDEDYQKFNEEQDIASTKKSQRVLNILKQRNPSAKSDLEALLLAFEKGQAQDRMDINRLGAENDQEEMDIEKLERALQKLKQRSGITEADKDNKAMAAAMDAVEKQFKDLPKYKVSSPEQRAKDYANRQKQAMQKAKENAKMLMDIAKKHGESISAKEVGYFASGIADGKRGDSDPRASDAYGSNVYAYDAGVRVGATMRKKTNEDYYETDEQRELARLGRILKDMGKKRDDDVGEAMGFLGTQLTRYGTPQGVNSIEKLVQVTGQPESVIMKMMALAQKVKGDVAVGDETAIDDEEVKEADFDDKFSKYISYTLGGGKPAQMLKKQAAQTQQMNKDLDPGAAEKGLGIGVLDTAKARKKAKEKGVRAPGSLRSSPNTRNPERLPEEESPMVSLTVPNVTFDMAQKLEKLAKENNVQYSRKGRTVVLKGRRMDMTRVRTKMGIAQTNLEVVPVDEALDHDIKIGDTVETKKMGQMQGVVTGFSTKTGDTRVMFKHKSGKVYATIPDNLRVISSKKTESLDDTVVEAKKKPVPTKPDKWAYAKAQAKKKYDVYPSAYANAWAAKKYKELGGGWRMGTKEDIEEMEQLEELKCWPGYERVPGTTAGEVGSCRKKGKK